MRISTNSVISTYTKNLADAVAKRDSAQLKVTTGASFNSAAEDPKGIANSKYLSSIISRNTQYQKNLDSAYNEITVVHDELESMSDQLTTLRDLAITSTQTGNSQTSVSLGVQVKGILEDLVQSANTDYKGKFLFSGTATTSESLNLDPPSTDSLPFEIVTGEATADNPSGLKVVFKGNNKDRIINKDANSTEVINTTAETAFGAEGTGLFNDIIDLYNIMTYNSDGTKRSDTDVMTSDDFTKVNELQKSITNYYEDINNVVAQFGSKMVRLEVISDQMTSEESRLNDILSAIQDTDYASTAIELASAENILNYSLQVGTQILQQNLLDFMS